VAGSQAPSISEAAEPAPEGDGWVNWSGLATLLAELGARVVGALDCLLHTYVVLDEIEAHW